MIDKKALYEEFHVKTMLSKLKKSKDDPSKWPKSWLYVHYKSYPRFKSILLKPKTTRVGLIHAIKNRETKRDFSRKPITISDLSTILHYSAGVTRPNKNPDHMRRAYPSGGGRYPLETYCVVLRGKGIKPGLYHYNVKADTLEILLKGSQLKEVRKFLSEDWVDNASCVFLFTAIMKRNTIKYGDRGYRLIITDYGSISQNLHLLATGLGYGTCNLGGYIDTEANKFLDIDWKNETIIGTIVLGK